MGLKTSSYCYEKDPAVVLNHTLESVVIFWCSGFSRNTVAATISIAPKAQF